MYQKLFMDPAEISKMMTEVKLPDVSAMMDVWKLPSSGPVSMQSPAAMMDSLQPEAMTSLMRHNLDAMTKSFEALIEGSQDIMKFQSDWYANLLLEIEKATSALVEASSPQTAVELQRDATMSALHSVMDAMQQIAEMTGSTASKSMAPLNARANTMMLEVQEMLGAVAAATDAKQAAPGKPARTSAKKETVVAAAAPKVKAKVAAKKAPAKPAASKAVKATPSKVAAPAKAATEPKAATPPKAVAVAKSPAPAKAETPAPVKAVAPQQVAKTEAASEAPKKASSAA